MFDMHHIISDGTSMNVLIRDFAAIYNGETLTDLRIQYKDFSEWQHEIFQGETIKQQESYWLNRFAGEVPVLNLPTDYPRPAAQSFSGEVIHFGLDPDLTGRLNQLAVQNGATLYMVLLAAYTILLAKYSGQEDIVIGSPIAGRPHADLENIIGMFVNTLAMRNHPTGEKTFQEFLAEVKAGALQAYESQDYQFEELVEKLNIRRDLSRNPLFDTMFVLQNQDVGSTEISGLTITPYTYENKIAKFDLTLQAIEEKNRIYFALEYCTKLFKPETVQRMAKHIIHFIEAVVSHPTVKLSEIELISEEEKQQILYEFNDTKAEYPHDKTIQELFEEQVAKTPGNIALVYEDRQMTYGELNQKANQLARLLRNKGVKADTIVGLMVERSFAMIIGILGILKAGGAYLPIDPEYPVDRIRFMLEDSWANILLTQSHLQGKYRFNQEIFELDDPGIYGGVGTDLKVINQPNDLAYVIYTSGSTGRPKGG
jgi:non-ribosomal peptide synthetase component F